MKTDFHLHTAASDGILEPADLVRQLAAHGVLWAALTDHDTVAGWPSASEEARGTGVELMAGAELSVVCHGERIHLLALGIDPFHGPLAAWLEAYRTDRLGRAAAMVQRLRELGVPFDEDTLPHRTAGRVITRPHLADAIVAAGGAASTEEAFDRFLGDDAPCFVPVRPRTSAEAIRMIRGAGGIAVLAHPGDWTAHGTVLALASEGLDGLEIGHPSHDDTLTTYYGSLAASLGLVVTAGSDFHGRRPEEFDRLGTFRLEEPLLDLLRERLRMARTRA